MKQSAAQKAARKTAPAKAATSTTVKESDTFFAATQNGASGAAGGDFAQVESQKRQPRQAGRGGRGGAGGERGGFVARGRGGNGEGRGGRRDGDRPDRRPRTAKPDADGNVPEKKPYQGKPRGEGQERRGGADRRGGRGGKDGDRRGDRNADGVYKKKGADGETEEKKDAEVVVEEEKKEVEPKVQYVEEILGYSLEDVLAGKQTLGKKEGRAGEKFNQKTEVGTEKTKQSTLLQNVYMKNIMGKVAGANGALLGVQAEEFDAAPARGPRGDDRGPQRGGRRQNAKVSLKKTVEDFPTL
jgi:hypothetical protein